MYSHPLLYIGSFCAAAYDQHASNGQMAEGYCPTENRMETAVKSKAKKCTYWKSEIKLENIQLSSNIYGDNNNVNTSD